MTTKQNKQVQKPLKVQEETPYYILMEPDPTLDLYTDHPYFVEKLARAKETIKRVGLPKKFSSTR